MTEQEWLESTKPEALLQFLARKRTRGLLRKLRLFGCAACRRIEPSLPGRAQEIVSTVEALSDQDHRSQVDCLPDGSKLEAIMAGNYEAGEKARAACHAVSSLRFMLLRDRTNHAAFAAMLLLREAVVAITGKRPKSEGYVGWTPHLTARWDKQGNAVKGTLADLLRHIIGNPFHPCPASPSWPSLVAQLAQALYNGDDCRLPLSDSLEESGYQELAEHFRQEEWHPKGCWVMDLILGKR